MTEPHITPMQFVIARGARKLAGELLRGNLLQREAMAACIDRTREIAHAVIAQVPERYRADFLKRIRPRFQTIHQAREILKTTYGL